MNELKELLDDCVNSLAILRLLQKGNGDTVGAKLTTVLINRIKEKRDAPQGIII
ncbi:MAG TPA: hypothetical protein VFM18_21780 [Methanosarcina sp.]|nr:hypothetical protein [Methanosarcina sp.]